MTNVEILDSTLRDGSQGEGISYSVQDKIHIVQALDELGVKYIEAGNPGSNPKDMEFFQKAKELKLKNSRIVAFGSTRRKDVSCAEDVNLQSLLSAETQDVVIFGKTWDFQATEILHASLEENLEMIEDTCAYLRSRGRNVIFDAEHFFTGYKANPEYALKSLEAAVKGGAGVLSLCETKGGCLPNEVYEITKAAVEKFGKACVVGIHTHNDSGLAVANSIMAVHAGATHVQGVLLGFGERTGNANLSTIIADLQLKADCICVPEENLKLLTPICKRVAEITNIPLDTGMPYVGQNAFTHKAGMHIDAVLKNPFAYEHIEPEKVGNERVFLMSEVAGRSMIIEKIQKFDSTITKSSPIVTDIIKQVKELEHHGYQFEGADGSFELLVRKAIGKYQPFFKLHYYKTSDEYPLIEDGLYSYAQLKIDVEGTIRIAAGEGNGPVNALDSALRSALKKFYPSVEQIHLTDYKVRVLDGKDATAAKVRVLIESSDGTESWSTIGVSCDVVEASWLALVDSFEYKLIKDIERKYQKLI
ncbi:MAG: citramalate synthase [Treponema sp.]|nr:citramalate synthase [Spirochaetia bacterium]MDY4902382.1 citramalate synthase [Treponema sp.]